MQRFKFEANRKRNSNNSDINRANRKVFHSNNERNEQSDKVKWVGPEVIDIQNINIENLAAISNLQEILSRKIPNLEYREGEYFVVSGLFLFSIC